MIPLAFHHVGCAVREINRSLRTYGESLGSRRRSPIFRVASQGVRVCFLELAPGSYLELIQGDGDRSPVDRYYESGFYHLCFLVDDLTTATADLETRQFRALPVFASEAFAGNKCQFLLTPEMHLIELAEMTPEAFASFFDENAA